MHPLPLPVEIQKKINYIKFIFVQTPSKKYIVGLWTFASGIKAFLTK